MADPKFNLVIDSACDLSNDIAHLDGVELISLTYNDGSTERPDDLFETVTAHEFYESMRKGTDYTTSQVNILSIQETYEKLAQEGIPVISIGISKGISGTYEACRIAQRTVQEEYPDFELYVVDTCVASTPLGVLVTELLRKRDAGLSAKEAYEWIEEARWHVQTLFMVEDLDTLHRGGRIPASVAVAGTKLDVKPMLSFDDEGALAVVGVARGRKKGFRQLAEFYQKNHAEGPEGNWASIGNADCPQDVERVMSIIRADPSCADADLVMTDIGAVIGSHVGPGMISISFFGSDRRVEKSLMQRMTGLLSK